MRRSEFLKAAALGALLPGVAHIAAGAPLSTPSRPAWPGDMADGEEFWKFVRAQFPLTTDRVYLNTGGLGASPYAVIDTVKARMDEFEKISETGHSEQLWKEIKESLGKFLGCDADELAFTRNTTEGVNIVANGFPLKPGDEIITSTHEHVGNAINWLHLTQRTGAVLRLFEPSTTSAAGNVDRIRALMNRKTRVISIPHATTTTGQVMPVRDIADLAHSRTVWLFVDGAQTAGMFPFNLHDLGCDAYATSGHKWMLGPKETGLLYVRKEMLDVIQAKHIGAYSDGGFDFLKGTMKLNPTAQRYEYGTVSIPLRAGLAAAVAFLQRIGMERVWKRDQALAQRLFDGLMAIPDVTVLSPHNPAERSAMITFMHAKVPYLDVQKHLNTFNLRTRGVSEGGLAALRISLHVYNSFDEVDTVLEGVRTVRS